MRLLVGYFSTSFANRQGARRMSWLLFASKDKWPSANWKAEHARLPQACGVWVCAEAIASHCLSITVSNGWRSSSERALLARSLSR